MKKIVILLFFLFPIYVSAQIAIIEIPFQQVKTDHLGNVYLLEKNKLSKYNKNGEFLYSYNNSNTGVISSFDVSDPFKILVFDKEYNQLFYLNAQLSLISDIIRLDDLGISSSELACKSAKEGFWVFDSSTLELKYFNQQNRLIYKSLNLDLIIEYTEAPNFLVERNNLLFLNFKSIGIIVFDSFGAFLKKIAIKDLENFQVQRNEIIYFKTDSLVRYNYNLNTKNSTQFLSEKGVNNILVQNNLFYFIKNESIEIVVK